VITYVLPTLQETERFRKERIRCCLPVEAVYGGSIDNVRGRDYDQVRVDTRLIQYYDDLSEYREVIEYLESHSKSVEYFVFD
jgi:hypothetical protein